VGASSNVPGFLLARFTANGVLDTSFNGSGFGFYLPGVAQYGGSQQHIARQANGKFVVIGTCVGIDGAADTFVARLNANLTLDSAFGGGAGYVQLDVDGLASQTQEVALDLVIQPDGKIIVAGYADQPGVPSSSERFLARFNPDGTMLASGGNDGIVTLWDAISHEQAGKPLAGTNGSVLDLQFTANGAILWTANEDGTLSTWSLSSRKQTGEPFIAHTGPVRSLSLNADEKIMASAGDDGKITFWDVDTRLQVGDSLSGHEGSVYNVQFSSDGKTLASAGFDGTIILWDAVTHEMIGEPLTGNGKSAYAVGFNPDSSILASGWGNGTTILWDVETRMVLGQPMLGFGNLVTSVSFSNDGNLLAFSDSSGLIHFLKVNPGVWESGLCQKAGRNFIPAEWAYFFHDAAYRVTCPQWLNGE
jgi:uncharacterized delta-60 repeat protein